MTIPPASFKTAVARVDISYRKPGSSEPATELKNEIVRLDQPFSNDALRITASVSLSEEKSCVLSYHVKAFKPLELVHFEVKYFADLKDQRMLANGFQSWSQAREMEADDRIPAIRSTVAYLTQYNLQGLVSHALPLHGLRAKTRSIATMTFSRTVVKRGTSTLAATRISVMSETSLVSMVPCQNILDIPILRATLTITH